MATLDRLFGFTDDATAGGKDYDALVAGAIPDATEFYPVTGGNFNPNIERIDRNDEARGRRANVAPRPFRSAPTMTVPLACYRKAAERMLYKCMGVKSTTGGGGATPYTHLLTTLGYPTVTLPALHTQLVRDSLNIKMAGATVNSVAMDFPLDGEGTLNIEFFGHYFNHFSSATPASDFTGFGDTVDTMMLRDASAYIDGSVTKIPDLQGFNLTFNNNLIRKWYAGRNVVTSTLGTPTVQTKKLWFPAENKAQAAPEITYSLTFGNTESAQEIAHWFAQTQRFDFHVVGLPLSGAYSATNEEIIISIYSGVHTDGGAGDLTARDDIVSTFNGGVFYSEAQGADLEIRVISDTPTLS